MPEGRDPDARWAPPRRGPLAVARRSSRHAGCLIASPEAAVAACAPAIAAPERTATALPTLAPSPPVSRSEVALGFLFANHRANRDGGALMSLGATVRAATEQLEARGLLDGAALDRRRDELGEDEERERARLRLQVIYDDDPTDKYAAPAVVIDCASRVALCRAACCRLGFSLTPQDLREGIVAWDFGAPYRNAQRSGGYCRHLDHNSHTCEVYAHRPRVCRTHDCRADRRIWIDFDARIVNPDILLPQ